MIKIDTNETGENVTITLSSSVEQASMDICGVSRAILKAYLTLMKQAGVPMADIYQVYGNTVGLIVKNAFEGIHAEVMPGLKRSSADQQDISAWQNPPETGEIDIGAWQWSQDE